MSDHEFEKRVRQRLDHLKLTPTAESWEKIEEQLRKERRRSPVLWMPLLLTGIIAGGMLLHHITLTSHPIVAAAGTVSQTRKQPNSVLQPPSESPTQNNSPASGPASANKPGIDAPTGKSGLSEPSKTEHDISGPDAVGYSNPAKQSPRPDGGSQPESPITTGYKTSHAPLHNVPIRPAATASSDMAKTLNGSLHNESKPRARRSMDKSFIQDNPNSPGLTASAAISDMNREINGHQYAKSTPVARYPDLAFLPAADAVRPSVFRARKLAPPAATPVAQANNSSKSKTSKWSFGVAGYGGIAAVNEGGLLSTNKPKVEDVAYNSRASFAPTYQPVSKPSSITPGPAFSTGLFANRQLSKRVSISAGLNYTQLNTRTKVGQRVNDNTIVNNGPAGYLYVQSYFMVDQNDQMEYKNRYHFLELPLTVNVRINNSTRFPIYWNGGMIVGRLLRSTSLHFDGTTGVYYKNDRLLNQTQAGVTTGFSVALFNNTAHPLWIGPTIRSNLSSVLKKDISSSNHFTSFGLDVRFLLKK